MVVHERLDLDALLEPAIGALSALRDELRELEHAGVVIDLLEPEQVLDPAVVARTGRESSSASSSTLVGPSTRSTTVFLAGNVIPS